MGLFGLFGDSKEKKQANKEYTSIGQRAAQMTDVATGRSAADYGRYEKFIDPMQGAWGKRFFDENGNFVAPGGGGGGYVAPNYNLTDYSQNKDFYAKLRDEGWASPEDKYAASGYGKFQAAGEGGLRGLLGADEYGRLKSGGLVNFMPSFEQGSLLAGRINTLGAGRMGGNLRQMMQDQVRGNTAFMGNLASQSADATKWGAGKGLEYANATTANRMGGASGVTSMADKLNEYEREMAAGRNAANARSAEWDRDMFNDMWKYGMSGAELTSGNSKDWFGAGQQSLGQRLSANNAYAAYNPNRSALDKLSQLGSAIGGIAGAATGFGSIGGGLLPKKKKIDFGDLRGEGGAF